jgi:predicted O-methyltransferase YrrM
LNSTFLNRPLRSETELSRHRLELNPEASLFHATDDGETQFEYLALISALIGIFKPTCLVETGTWHGDGAAAMLQAAGPGSRVITLCHHPLSQEVRDGLQAIANEQQNEVTFVQANTRELIAKRSGFSWRELTHGKATFAFLDSSIPDRSYEFAYIS